MALYLDRIEDAGYIETTTGRSHRRAAIVTGVSTANPAAVCYLATQVAGMPQRGDAHPVHPECVVTDIEAVGITESDDSIRVMLTYGFPFASEAGQPGGGGSFLYEDSTGLIGDRSELVPGPDKSPLKIIYRDAALKFYGPYQGSIEWQRPIRTITVSGALKKGVSLAPYRYAMGTVNLDTWNGLKRGYWLMTGINTTTTDGETYSIKVQVVTRNNDDWSQYIIGRDHNLDQFFTVDKKVATDLAGKDYDYGITLPDGKNDKGIIRVGPYQMTNFSDIFGSPS
jgi:hypothetical protein